MNYLEEALRVLSGQLLIIPLSLYNSEFVCVTLKKYTWSPISSVADCIEDLLLIVFRTEKSYGRV
jgi:hypothetical protein